ncbi:MAG: DNA double-strand break repair nuclease NurA [Treponema sp.]|nr:DNA double-strand break repair nuclease NurA [Treponema sp.]
MSFEGEFAHYEPLRRIFSNEKVQKFLDELQVQDISSQADIVLGKVIKKTDLPVTNNQQPDLILAIDGSVAEGTVNKGFPSANFGCITVASVLMDLKKIRVIEQQKFPNPQDVVDTESASSIEAIFPGCNVIRQGEKDAKSYFRKTLYEELKNNYAFPNGGESLLETYEYLLDIKCNQLGGMGRLPKSPIDGVDEDMTVQYGEYPCPYTGEPLYSTDALRLHELLNPSGTNGELFGQVMATFEKLWFVNVLRSFEKKNWLATLRRVAFFVDGPLAVFSTSSWLAKSITVELRRLNKLQKEINHQDMIILGVEKSGTFFNHFQDLDMNKEGVVDYFPREAALLLDDEYIKKHIEFSESTKPYGEDTYFGRKFFYKASSGQKIVPVIASYSDYERDILTALPEQFSRLRDVMDLLDQLVSSRYQNSITPLISAHAEAAIPFNLGQKLFEQIAREIREKGQ